MINAKKTWRHLLNDVAFIAIVLGSVFGWAWFILTMLGYAN